MTLYKYNEIIFFFPSVGDINISYNQIISSLGYRDVPLPLFVLQIVQQVLDKAPTLITPKCTLSIAPCGAFDVRKKEMRCNSVTFQTESIITKQLTSASTVAFFVCSIGSSMENWAKREMDAGDLLQGYIIDRVASEYVEALADWMENELDKYLKSLTWKRTNRYSPGYCNWSVSEQNKLFSFFPPNPSGVSLTEGSLMIPIKSVSGIIGVGPDAEKKDYECSLCDLHDCCKRRHLHRLEVSPQ